jgi:TP901 family phage tail tape measure protein
MAANRSSIEAGKGHVTLGVKDGPLVSGLKAAEGRLRAWGGNVARIGASIAAAGVGMLSGLMPGVMAFASYEQALADLRAAADPAAADFARLREQIELVGKATGTDLVEVTKAYGELLKAGVSLESVLGGVGEAAIKFARVSGMEMAQTAVVLVDAMNVFAREGVSATAAANIMNQAADASTISLQEVADAFAAGGSTMALFQQNMRDTATAIAILGNAGIKGSDAGTALKTVMMRLATGSESAGAAMAELGLQVRDSSGQMLPMVEILGNLDRALAGRGAADRDRLLADLAGSFGIRGLAVLLQSGTAGWNAMQASMNTALTVEQKFAIMNETLLGSLKRIWVQIQGIAVAVGEALAPALGVIGKIALPVLEIIAQFVRANQIAVQIFAAVAVALVAVGSAALAVGGAMLLLAPVFAVLASVASGVATSFAWLPTLVLWSDYARYSILGLTGVLRLLGVEMRNIWEPLGIIDDVFDDLMNTLTGLASGTIFADIGNAVRAMFDEFTHSQVGQLIQDILLVFVAVNAVAAAVVALGGYLIYLAAVEVFTEWVRRAREFMPVVRQLFTLWLEGIGYIAAAFRVVFRPLLDLARGIGATIQSIYSAAAANISAAWETTVAEFSRVASGLVNTATQAWGAMTEAFGAGDWENIWNIITATVQLAWAQIKSFVEPTWNAWKDALIDTFTSAIVIIKAAFTRLWGEVRAQAYDALADTAAAGGFTESARGFRLQAQLARMVARNEAAATGESEADIGAWFNEQALRVARDMAVQSGSAAEIAAAQAELDRFNHLAAARAAANLALGVHSVLLGLGQPGAGTRPPVVPGEAGMSTAGTGSLAGGFGALAQLAITGQLSPEAREVRRHAERMQVLHSINDHIQALIGEVVLRVA